MNREQRRQAEKNARKKPREQVFAEGVMKGAELNLQAVERVVPLTDAQKAEIGFAFEQILRES